MPPIRKVGRDEILVPRTSTFPSLRLGQVEDVNITKGTAFVRWLDHFGGRNDIVLSQSSFGEYAFPVKRAVCLFAMVAPDVAHIVRYLPINYAELVNQGYVRQLRPGERVLQSFAGNDKEGTPILSGAEFYMDVRGNIELSTGFGSATWGLQQVDNLIAQDSERYEVKADECQLNFGMVKRKTTDVLGDTQTFIVTESSGDISSGNKPLNEFKIKVLEKQPFDGDELQQSPIVELSLGTSIDNTGTKLTGTSGQQIVIDLNTASSVGFRFLVDKDGNVEMQIKSGKKLTIKSDIIELGNGTVKKLVNEEFKDLFNSHKHTGVSTGGGSSGPPSSTIDSSHLTSDTKAS